MGGVSSALISSTPYSSLVKALGVSDLYQLLGVSTILYDYLGKKQHIKTEEILKDSCLDLVQWSKVESKVNINKAVGLNHLIPRRVPVVQFTNGENHFFNNWILDRDTAVYQILSEDVVISELKLKTRHCLISTGAIEVCENTQFYFEITLTKLPVKSILSLGFVPFGYPNTQHPGWNAGSFGYHSDDGNIYSEKALKGLSKFEKGDVIGCGIHGVRLFFIEKDGNIHYLPVNIPKGTYYPAVGMKGPSQWNFNFGYSMFHHIQPFLSFQQGINRELGLLVEIPITIYSEILMYLSWADISAFLLTSKAIRNYLSEIIHFADYPTILRQLIGFYTTGGRCFVLYGTKIYFSTYFANEYDWGLVRSRDQKEMRMEGNSAVPQLFNVTGDEKISFDSIPFLGKLNKLMNKSSYESLVIESRIHMIECGVNTTEVVEDTCCHGVVKKIAFDVFQQVPKDSPHYDEILMALPQIVQTEARSCMMESRPRQTIITNIVSQIIQIDPQISTNFAPFIHINL